MRHYLWELHPTVEVDLGLLLYIYTLLLVNQCKATSSPSMTSIEFDKREAEVYKCALWRMDAALAPSSDTVQEYRPPHPRGQSLYFTSPTILSLSAVALVCPPFIPPDGWVHPQSLQVS